MIEDTLSKIEALLSDEQVDMEQVCGGCAAALVRHVGRLDLSPDEEKRLETAIYRQARKTHWPIVMAEDVPWLIVMARGEDEAPAPAEAVTDVDDNRVANGDLTNG